MLQVYEFIEYRSFLRLQLEHLAKTQRGIKSRLADAIGCNSSYITHVLQEQAHLSPDQGLLAGEFLGLKPQEIEFFLDLIQLGRAATPNLQKLYKKKIDETRQRRDQIRGRVKADLEVSAEVEHLYFGNWHFISTHVFLTTAPPGGFSSVEISEALRLPVWQIEAALQFLLERNLALKTDSGKYRSGPFRVHVGSDRSPVQKHHTNCRLRALLDSESTPPDHSQSLHYSSLIAIREKDAQKIRQVFLKAIEEARSEIRASSPEESVYCYTLDWFKISGTKQN